jgi:pyroglutamyl-peptidase
LKVLITGFTPFGGEKINPSYEAVKLLNDEIAGAKVVKLEIPTVFNKSIEALDKAIVAENPDIVICIGQAGGRFEISVERIAINMDDARIGDNEGNKPVDEAIYQDGENAYFSSLPIKAMVKRIRENNIPANVSNTAGTFVCNHIMYGLLYLANKKYPNIKGGFIHVPYIPQQVIDKKNMPYMTLNEIVDGLTYAIEAAVENKEDIKLSCGKIC